MKTSTFILAYSIVGLCTACKSGIERATVSATDAGAIPQGLAGEWRNSENRNSYAAIYLFADGRGAFLTTDSTTTVAFKITAQYDHATHMLTATVFSGEAKPPVIHLDYDTSTQAFVSRKGEWGASHTPFKRLSPKIPKEIKEELE